MSLKISEIENKKIAVHNTQCALDQLLTTDDISPLPACSGFSILIVGSSGSGKSTMVHSIMTKPKKLEICICMINLFLPKYQTQSDISYASCLKLKFACLNS